MKKYNLKLKKEYIITGFNINGLAKRLPNRYYSFKWLAEDSVDQNRFTYTYNQDQFVELTQQEIDDLPYGFVKMHDIIEVEEQLYYIKLPFLPPIGCYINLDDDGRVFLSDKSALSACETRFTKQEIEENFPMFANDYFMVKVEDVNKI